MGQIGRLKAKIEWSARYKVPHRIYDIESRVGRGDPIRISKALLRRIARSLKIDPDLSQLRFDKVKETILGSHVLYQQYYRDKPISGAWIRIDIDKEGKVYNIINDLVPQPIMTQTKRKEAQRTARAKAPKHLTAKEARDRALEATHSAEAKMAEVLQQELVYFPYKGIPTLAWKVVVQTTSPAAEWKAYLDAVSGTLLERINLLKSVNGMGRVFDPNPVVVLSDTGLEDRSTIPAAAYSDVTLRDLKKTGLLDGPYVSTRNTSKRVKRADFRFLFDRKKRAFKEVMAYFHIDRIQRHIQDLGFKNVLNHAIDVNIDGTKEDNSFYSPTTKALTFGTGGVDDAEDAEIILHEYGHAVQDNQVPGFGASHEAGAMGEGFGDFQAASFFADVKPQRMRPTIGNWDAVAYSGAEPPCLRRLDSNKKYPKDMDGEVHDDGEIWSACLWEIRTALGRQATEKLVIAHHFLLTRKATFENAANALITTDKKLNQGRNLSVIHDVFIRRGILPNPKRKYKRAGVPFDETVGKTREK